MTEPEYDVFLSYSSHDHAIAQRIYERLRAQGFLVWMDRIVVLPGENFERKVFEALGKSRFIAILLTQRSVESSWVQEELSAGRVRELEEKRVVVLPLLYEDCRLPDSLRNKAYADFRYSFEQGIRALEAGMRTHMQPARPGSAGSEPVVTGGPSSEHNRDRLRAALTGTETLFLVMDIGGTKAYVSLISAEAERLFDRKFASEGHGSVDRLFDFIKHCIRNVIDGIQELSDLGPAQVTQRIRAIGIAFAGVVDPERGIIMEASNFQVREFPLASRLNKTFNIPTYVDNDVNLGVLGEHWKGVARGHRSVVGIIIGTGVGGGIIIDGQIHRGRNKTAGEIGHIVLDHHSEHRCGCGQLGCFEALASRRAIARELHRRKAEKKLTSFIWAEKNLGSNEIAHHFQSLDEDAIAAVNDAARICGKAVFSILYLLNPDIIFFGGGFIRQLGDVFLRPVREEAAKCVDAVHGPGEKQILITLGQLDNPILIGACKMLVDITTGARHHSRSALINAVLGELKDDDLRLLHEFYRANLPLPVSANPQSDLFEDRLRELRNRGLIETLGASFRRSTKVQITPLGRMIVEELLETSRLGEHEHLRSFA